MMTRDAAFKDIEAVSTLFNLYRQFYEQAPDAPCHRYSKVASRGDLAPQCGTNCSK